MTTANNSRSKNFLVKAAFTVWFAFFTTASFASDFYWVGGTGNWSDYGTHWATSSGGVIFHTTIPTLNDNIYFDANSFSSADTVTMDVAAPYCNNMDWTGAQFGPLFQYSNGNSAPLKLYGSITLAPGMQFLVDVDFMAATGNQYITCNGSSMRIIVLVGGATFNLNDDLFTNQIYIGDATFNSNSHDISCHDIHIAVASVDLGSSQITCNGKLYLDEDPLSFISSAASIVFTNYGEIDASSVTLTNPVQFNNVSFLSQGNIGGDFSFICNNLIATDNVGINNAQTAVIHRGVFYGNVTIQATTTFDSLLLNNPGHIFNMINTSPTITINQDMSINGTCGLPVSIIGGSFFKSSGTVAINFVILSYNTATGGATFIANNSVNAGNNSGWTINSSPPQNLYWIGGSGNWSDPNHWSLSSGGTGGSCIPTLNDNIYFDANSFSSADTVTMDVAAPYCNNMDWTGAQFGPLFQYSNGNSAPLKLYGSITLAPGMQFLVDVDFMAATGNQYITCNGSSMRIIVLVGGATFNLNDDLFTNQIYIGDATFNSNSHDISCHDIHIAVASVDLGSSQITCNGKLYLDEDPLSFISSAASIVFTNYGEIDASSVTLTNPVQFNNVSFLSQGNIGGDFSFICNNLIATDNVGINNAQTAVIHRGVFYGNVTIQATTTFDSLLLNNPGHIFNMINTSPTITINQDMSINGTCGLPVSIIGGSFFKSSGTVAINFVILSYNTATGGATFIANNSVNAGNNSGWTINSSPPQNLYWIGGSGNWSDPNHWSLSSGGTGGSCIPTLNDNIYFDANSFSSADTVTMDVAAPYCNNMDWTGAQFGPLFQYSNGNSAPLKLYGSITLAPGMQFLVDVDFMAATGNQYITCNGSSMRIIVLVGGATFNLNDDLFTNQIYIGDATFNSNSHDISCHDIHIAVASVDLGSSQITCNGKLYLDEDPLSFISSAASIVFTNYGEIDASSVTLTNPVQFNNVSFLSQGNIGGDFSFICNNLIATDNVGINNAQTAVIHRGVFYGNVAIQATTTFDSLLLNNPGHIFNMINTSPTITINQDMSTSVNPGFPSQLTGGTIVKSSGQVCLDYYLIQNSTVSGGAGFYAGNNSVNLGGNSGWLWSSCTPDTSNVWPGDANYDLSANNVDVLYVGLAYGYTGTTRAGASNVWVAQPSVDWLQQFGNGVNLKNADCNGDGTIDNNDTTAISLNYGQTHPFKAAPPLPSTNSVGIPFYLVSNLDSAGLNFTVNLDMSLGNSSLQINNLYGLAFTLNFDTGYIDTNNVSFDFSNSMMGTPGVDLMTFTKSFASQGYIDIAMARTDHNNISGYGHLARCGIVIVDNVAGLSVLPFTITNITAFDKNEFPVTLTSYGDSLVVDTNLVASTHQIDLTQFVSVYPNPAKDLLKINGGLLNIQSVELISIMGEKIYNKKVDAHTTSISTQNIKDGLYMLRCITNKGIVNRRVQVLK